MTEAEKDTKPAPDWERIELDYRAGIKTLRQIAEENGITHGAVNKRAKRDGWERDLAEKIRAKADALVSRAAVSESVSVETKAAEKALVEANAEMQYRTRMEHRSDIAELKALFRTLVGEAKASAVIGDLAEQLLEVMNPPSEEDSPAAARRADKQRELLEKILSHAGRVDSAKKLADMYEKIFNMDRISAGIDDKKNVIASPGEISITF